MQQYPWVRNALAVLDQASQRPGSCFALDRPETGEADVAEDGESGDGIESRWEGVPGSELP